MRSCIQGRNRPSGKRSAKRGTCAASSSIPTRSPTRVMPPPSFTIARRPRRLFRRRPELPGPRILVRGQNGTFAFSRCAMADSGLWRNSPAEARPWQCARASMTSDRPEAQTRASPRRCLVAPACRGGANSLKVARSTRRANSKFGRGLRNRSQGSSLKHIPYEELTREVEILVKLFERTSRFCYLKKFVESTEAMPYLP